MQIPEIMKRIIELCQTYHADAVYLFGSRAKGTEQPRSDIDIAVTGVRDIDGLREAVDLIPTLYKIDLVDMETCSNEYLMEDIKQYGRKIYEKI